METCKNKHGTSFQLFRETIWRLTRINMVASFQLFMETIWRLTRINMVTSFQLFRETIWRLILTHSPTKLYRPGPSYQYYGPLGKPARWMSFSMHLNESQFKRCIWTLVVQFQVWEYWFQIVRNYFSVKYRRSLRIFMKTHEVLEMLTLI